MNILQSAATIISTLSPTEAHRLTQHCRAWPDGSPEKQAATLLANALQPALAQPIPAKTGILLIVTTP